MYQNEQVQFTPEVSGEKILNIINEYQNALFFYQAFETGVFDKLKDAKKRRYISKRIRLYNRQTGSFT